MIHTPAFRRNLKPAFVDRDRAILASRDERILIEGPYCGCVAARVDGRSPAHEIVDALAIEADLLGVLHALVQLEQKGLLIDAASDLPSMETAFWRELDVAPRDAADRLKRARFDICCMSEQSAEPIDEALASVGLTRDAGAPFAVVLADDYLDPRLIGLNREYRARGVSWLLVKPLGIAWVGPLFHRNTPCWECLAWRLRENRLDRSDSQEAGLQVTSEWIANLAATECAKWVARGASALENGIAVVDPFRLTMEIHQVIRRPQCPECGSDLRLDPSRLAGPCWPDDHHLLEQVNPIAGIVPLVGRRGARHDHLPVMCAPQRLPLRCESEEGEPATLAVGTAPSEHEARISCVGEAVERYSAAFDGTEIILRRRASSLDEPYISAPELLQISERQYQDREEFNRTSGLWMPERPDVVAEMDWTPVWSLTRGETFWVPAGCVFLRYPSEAFGVDSNGCAAGRTIDDAIVRGFCELVERDALALWWYNRVRRPGIPLACVENPIAGNLHQHLTLSGRTLDLLDLTTDLEMPVVAAISARADGSAVVFGFGAHFDPSSAVRHALLEMQQILGAVEDMLQDGSTPPSTPIERWLQSINLHDQMWLTPAPGERSGMAARAQTGGVTGCLEIARRNKIELLIANLTRPDLQIPVVRVMAPGLRPAQPRFAPGRLYDVPPALGWLETSWPESELNPFPFFL